MPPSFGFVFFVLVGSTSAWADVRLVTGNVLADSCFGLSHQSRSQTIEAFEDALQRANRAVDHCEIIHPEIAPYANRWRQGMQGRRIVCEEESTPPAQNRAANRGYEIVAFRPEIDSITRRGAGAVTTLVHEGFHYGSDNYSIEARLERVA